MVTHDFSAEQTIRQRYSVRTYDPRPLTVEHKALLQAYAQDLQNPLGPDIRVHFIDADLSGGEKLGTYGMIRGAKTFLAVTVPDVPHAPEALGYAFEKFVLYATSLGLGTCWLGGTFNRRAFAAQLDLQVGEVFPILCPVGYPTEKKQSDRKIFRKAIKADRRKSWDTLFFNGFDKQPLSPTEAGQYQIPLEMVRLAPSAVNFQPWRIVAEGNAFHFFEKRFPGNSIGGLDMQRIDLGIALCHFHLSAEELGLPGHFERRQLTVPLPEKSEYIISWIRE